MSRSLQLTSDAPDPDAPPPRRRWRDELQFLVSNRIPRIWATRFMGWFSKIESPLLTRLSIAVWRRFAPDLDLSEAKEATFRSVHDCFVRELAPGMRPVDPSPEIVTSPCDAIVGAHGRLDGIEALQVKGFPYRLDELLPDPELAERHRDGLYVTLRIKSSMYHRFHAPCDCRVTRVTHVAGDTWNVNPIALRRVEKLFCKNARAAVELDVPGDGRLLTLVPVAAILVAGIRLRCLEPVLDLGYRGPSLLPCDARYEKGEEMGHFQHGSTIVVFASGGYAFADGLREGQRIRVGQPLLRAPAPQPE